MISTEDHLRLHFEKFGTLDECVVKHSPGNVGNAFGFLWVRPVEAAEKIMAQDHIIHTASGNDISIPLSLEYKPFSDLIAQFEAIQQENPGFQLFNEKLVDGGYIKIPREIISKLK